MNQLKQYKELWNNQEITEKWNQSDLYKMMHKSSSSLVKWIFYISLIEFAFFLVLNIFVQTDWKSYYGALGLYGFMTGVNVTAYAILIVFIILFYRNYKQIKTTQSTKDLMQNIIKTRKTVKYYILVNIISMAFTMVYSFYYILLSPEYENLIETFGLTTVWLIVIFAILFLLGMVYLIYMLVYGYFIRKLKANYQELTEELIDL